MDGMTKEMMWDCLVEMGISDESLQLITKINGYSERTMLDVLQAKFGVYSFDQLKIA